MGLSNRAKFRAVQSELFLSCSSAVSSLTTMYVDCNPWTGFPSGHKLAASRKETTCFLAHVQEEKALVSKLVKSPKLDQTTTELLSLARNCQI